MSCHSQRRASSAATAVLGVCASLGCPHGYLRGQTSDGEPAWRAGASFQRTVAGAEPDRLRIPLAAGQFIRLDVMQKGVDLSVSFRDPSANSVADVDSGNEYFGPETVVAITPVAGVYTLEVKRQNPRGVPNFYNVRVLEVRQATPADLEIIAAHRNYAAAQKLIDARAPEAGSLAPGLFRGAHDSFSRSGDRYMEGLAAFGLGVASVRSVDFRGAIPWYEEAAASFRAASDAFMEGKALNNEGGALDVLGEPVESLKLHRRALSLFAAVGDPALEGLALNNIAATEAQLSQWQGALEHYQQALPLYREAGDRRTEGLVLNNMGVAYSQMGEREQALSLLGQALPLRQALGDKVGEATTLDALANTHFTRGEAAKSLEYLTEALALWRALGDRRGQGEALRMQGQALAALGRYDDSERALLQSFDLARGVDRRFAGMSLVYLATTFLSAGEPAKAVDYGEQATAEFRAIGDRRLEAISLEAIARAESARGNLNQARRRMEEGLAVSESARRGTDSQQLRASFFATRQDGYSFYIDLLMRIGGQDALALESSERSRARSLLEMLAASGTAIREGVDAKLLGRERDISNLLNAKGARLLALSATSPQAAELTQEVAISNPNTRTCRRLSAKAVLALRP